VKGGPPERGPRAAGGGQRAYPAGRGLRHTAGTPGVWRPWIRDPLRMGLSPVAQRRAWSPRHAQVRTGSQQKQAQDDAHVGGTQGHQTAKWTNSSTPLSKALSGEVVTALGRPRGSGERVREGWCAGSAPEERRGQGPLGPSPHHSRGSSSAPSAHASSRIGRAAQAAIGSHGSDGRHWCRKCSCQQRSCQQCPERRQEWYFLLVFQGKCFLLWNRTAVSSGHKWGKAT